VKSPAENVRMKLPYASPNLVRHSLRSFAACVRKEEAQDWHPVENHRPALGTQPAPLIVEGFQGDVADLVAVLSSIGWPSQGISELAGNAIESRSVKSEEQAVDPICILLVDMRRSNPGLRQPLTRIETDSASSGTLVLILTDSGDDFRVGSEIRHTDRWHFRGQITLAGLGVLVESVYKLWITMVASPANSNATLRTSGPKASAVAFRERH